MNRQAPRVVEVAPERWDRWAAGFAGRHGSTVTAATDCGLPLLTGADGATARVLPWAEDHPHTPEHLGLMLVRRGGYAVGHASGPTLGVHYCGTRYVQSRTAAGGWSQQRFARRRAGQADALVDSVATKAASMLSGLPLPAVVVGGDKALVAQVLAHDRLRVEVPAAAQAPRRAFHDLPDPRLAVLKTALARGRSLHIEVIDP